MKRRSDDQETAFGSQRRLPGGTESFHHRVVAAASSVYGAASENMQSAAGVQYSQVPQTFQVCDGCCLQVGWEQTTFRLKAACTVNQLIGKSLQSCLVIVVICNGVQVPLAQSSGGHGHSDSPAVHAGAHHHGPVVQPTGATVGQGHSHAPPASAPTPGQQQFQRLKVVHMQTSQSCF